ncbi:MAG: uroporphyrinogen decarboxylase family protein [Oscillospiraceae bacterium]|nr:uroporphyrinogen decarboxylase family protein [Oscillospiraceae bacterium]
MTSKERVLAAVRRQPADRVPRFIWVGRGAADNMTRALGLKREDIDDYVQNDVRQVWLSVNKQMETPCAEGQRFVDEWGITWQRDGYYNTPVIHPLAGLTAGEIATAPLPDPLDPARYVDLDALLASHGRTHFIGGDVSGTLFEPAYHLRSMEELMMDMAGGDEAADILLDRLTDFSAAVAVEAVRRGVDWVWLGDDMGTQVSMLMSPAMWRRYFKPRMKKIIDAVHAVKPDMIIAYHSCGFIEPILGELADIGIDVINPLQESAGMDHAAVKREHGGRMTMMCGLDTQTFLLSASPDEVRAAMKEKVALLAAGGGYIAAVSHTLQHDVPVENIVAMLEGMAEPPGV